MRNLKHVLLKMIKVYSYFIIISPCAIYEHLVLFAILYTDELIILNIQGVFAKLQDWPENNLSNIFVQPTKSLFNMTLGREQTATSVFHIFHRIPESLPAQGC